jgi:hypothetical protein
MFTVLLLLGGAADCLHAQSDDVESYYYGIEISGVLCGYAEIQLSESSHEGREVINIDENVFAMMTALGSAFNTRQHISYLVDPETGNFLVHENEVEQGDTHLGVKYVVRDDAVYMQSDDDEDETRIELPPGTVLSNTILFGWLADAFADPARRTMDCKLLQVRDGEVQDYSYTRLDDEVLDILGKKRSAMVVEEINRNTGLKMQLWIDKSDGKLLQVEVLTRKVTRTDESVVKRIKVADLDASILVKTNKSIADVQGIRSMKVAAKLKPVGLWLTEEGLNGPGQAFSGTVHENAIEGTFEISHARYDGANAPPFPPDYTMSAELKPYLEPSTFCESDDDAIIAKAREITRDAGSSWEAATRLSAWVAENIAYAIPGGGSAQKTFKTRAGECGAHSLLLAAMCRAVDIPARVIWGCMYTPNLGGSFGQHAWNEIYMGDAGWIPVDATAHETDFVDAGHLRIGEMESTVIALNAEEFEILDYTLGDGVAAAEATASHEIYLGTYAPEEGSEKEFTVLDENGKLALNIAGKMTLAFNEPDAEGFWQCQLAPQLRMQFTLDDGEATAITLFEENRMMRKKSAEEITEDAPEDLRPMIGTYILRGPNLEFKVLYENEELTLKEPKGATFALTKDPDTGYWTVGDGSRRIVFERGDNDAITAIVATHVTKMERMK